MFLYISFLKEPVSCEKCRTRNSFELIHNRCTFSNKQCIKLQETVESIPEGETPQVCSESCCKSNH